MPIFTSDLTSSGIIYADTIVTNSNEDLTLNPAGTGRVVVENELVVNTISSDDSTAVQINDGVNISGTLSANTIDVNTITSGDSSAVQLNDALNVSGVLTANASGNSLFVADTLRIAENGAGLRMTNVGAFDNSSGSFRVFSNNDLIFSAGGDSNTALTVDGTTRDITINNKLIVNTIDTNLLQSGDSTNIRVADNLVPAADNTYSLGSPDRRWSALYVEGSTIFLDTTKLQVDGSGDFTVKDAGNNLKRVVASEVEIGTGFNKIKIQRGNNGRVKFTDENDTPTPVLQIVGDDSTGVSLNTNETVKIAGTQNITTAVSGDTLTITGPDLSAYITAASTDTLTNKTFDANGTGNSISNIEVGDFASGEILDEDNMSSNSATKLATQQSIKAYVDSVAGGTLSMGDSASNSGSVDVNSGDNLEFRAGNSITPTVAGNGVTIALNDTIVVNAISSTDSSTVRINDSIETENAQINTNLTVDGNAQVKGNLTVQGTTTYIETTNTKISDPLLLLSNGNSGGSDIDAGIMIERGSAGNNAVFYWNEGDDKFKAVTTTSGEDATAITDTATATIVADLEGDVTASTIIVDTINTSDSSALTLATSMNVNGTLSATSKNFVIDHPTKPNHTLRYASLEGPENGVYVRGHLKNNSVIQLPDYWIKLVDPDSITVNLTACGHPQSLWVDAINQNTITVAGDDNINCFYVVYGTRIDIPTLEVESNGN